MFPGNELAICIGNVDAVTHLDALAVDETYQQVTFAAGFVELQGADRKIV